MISVIICSINKQLLHDISTNISETIGVEFEIVAFDNSFDSHGICKVYNECAAKAKYDFLCFVHEDVLFKTPDWGKLMIDANDQSTGVIGFAGGQIKTKYPSFWGDVPNNYTRIRISQIKKGKEKIYYNNPLNEDFAEVLMLDGVFLFTRRSVWQEFPFDENIFRRFHFYDLDFTFQIAQKYKNYVCNTVEILHLSKGSFSAEWYDEAKKFNHKWDKLLPASLHPLTQEEWDTVDFKALYVLVKHYLIKRNLNDLDLSFYLKLFIKRYPCNRKLITLIPKYFRKKIRDLFR